MDSDNVSVSSTSTSGTNITEQTRSEIRTCIHDWIKIDNENQPSIKKIDDALKNMAKQRKELMNKKKELEQRKKDKTDKILEIIKQQGVDSINIQSGKLVYKKRVTKKSISKKFLIGIVSNYFKNDNKEADVLTNYILNNRAETVVESLKRI
jgi:hypothetical protein